MNHLVTINTLQSHTIRREDGFWSVMLPNTNRYIFNVIRTASGDYGTTIDLKAHKTFMAALAYLLPFFREAVEAQRALPETINRLKNKEEKSLLSTSNGLTQLIKTAVIAATIVFATLPTVSQAENATDVNAAREAAAHADRMADALNGSLYSARSVRGIDADNSPAKPQAEAAAEARAKAHSDLAVAESLEAQAQTNNRVTTTTTAGSQAQTNPNAQVAVPMVSVFASKNGNGGNQHNATSHTRGGSSNGGQNAANSHSGMAHGFGDNHVGGGAAQSGSRNVGH